MSEEDKKIIEHLKYWVEFHIKHNTSVSPYSISCVGKALSLIEKQQKEIENSYKVKFKVGETAKLENGMSIGHMGNNHNKEVTIREIKIRKGYIDYYVDYTKDGEIHNFRCNLQERDLIKLEE